MTFDPAAFVTACRGAVEAGEGADAVREIVARAVAAPSAIERAFGAARAWENETLYRSPTLTVQKIWWPPGGMAPPHEHRMWAVIGVYAGREDNAFFRRDGVRVAPEGRRAHEAGEVLQLDPDVIHAVSNPRDEFTAALHVYGGDIIGTPRSAWTPPAFEEAAMNWPLVERLTAAFNARQATEPVPWSRERTMPLLMELMAGEAR